MNIYPKLYLDKVTDITIEMLNENNIKGLILDVDNTLIDIDRKMIDGLVEWKNNLEKNNIKFIILSNSNKKEKVGTVAENLNISYLNFAKKPFKSGFKKAALELNLENANIGVVGDQIFTDVIGANRCNMFSILVKPISEKDLLITKWKRPIENKIIQNFLNKKNTKD